MSDLFGNHIVGFSTRWLKCVLKTGKNVNVKEMCAFAIN